MKKHLFPISFLFLFCLWSLRSIFHSGFMYSHDSFWHVERLMNIFSLIPHQFPVRFSPTLDNGYGIPLFNFTYPAPYYLGALFMFFGLGPVKTYYTLLFVAYFGGGIGMYLLARKRLIGIFGSLLYLLTPYLFLDIFVRGALGEVMALGLIPWVILSYSDISETGACKWYSSLPLAILVLSHNFYGYLFCGLLVIFTLVFYHHKLKIFGSFLFSIALSSFFILPAFFEKSYLLIAQSMSHQFEAHFVYPIQLIYGKWIYLGSVAGNNPNEMSFQLGIANIILGITSLIYLIYSLFRRNFSVKLFCYILCLIFSILMTLPQSIWFWNHLPLIASLQFPWRFLGPAAILFSLIYIELGNVINPKYNRIYIIFSTILVIVAIINTRNYYRPVKWMNESEFLALHYEYVGKNTTASRDELAPVWAIKERYNSTLRPAIIAGEIKDYVDNPLKITFTVATSDAQDIVIQRNYFPTWIGTIDGKITPLTPTQTGEIIVPVIPGTHSYEIFYQSTPIEIIGNAISVLSFLVVIVILVKQYASKKKYHNSRDKHSKDR